MTMFGTNGILRCGLTAHKHRSFWSGWSRIWGRSATTWPPMLRDSPSPVRSGLSSTWNARLWKGKAWRRYVDWNNILKVQPISVSSNRFSVKPLRPISIQVTKKTESLPGKIVHACKKEKTVCVIMYNQHFCSNLWGFFAMPLYLYDTDSAGLILNESGNQDLKAFKPQFLTWKDETHRHL